MTEVSDPSAKSRILQRVVMPLDRDLEVLKLYVDSRVVRESGTLRAEGAASSPTDNPDPDEAEEVSATSEWDDADQIAGAGNTTTLVESGGSADRRTDGFDESMIRSRRSILVPAGHRMSFCTYFNAFPAGYWRRWTSVNEIVLRLRISGEAVVTIHRSTAKGRIHKIGTLSFATGEAQCDLPRAGTAATPAQEALAEEQTISLSLEPFIDGGWYWFDVTAGENPAVLESAEWCTLTAEDGRAQGRTSVGITTFNRADFCVRQLIAVGEAPEVLDIIDEIFVVDQGTEKIAEHPDFHKAVESLGGRLRVISQANLGGSGGFARAMDETIRAGKSDYILLLDDDIVAETESVLRAVAFADLARRPTIVGGHMFNLYLRSELHAFAEGIERYRWWWGPAIHTWPEHDFAENALWSTPWLHRRIDADYNGWWMCLIPITVVKEIGLSMPFFIKWDDAEYCVRAEQAGYPTVSLPGVAVWHVPWKDKDDGIDWQAYFHWRNRIVTALIHSPYDHGGNLLKESLFVCVKHALAMRYSAAELMLMAIEDVLHGPDHLHADIATQVEKIRAFRNRFPDARSESTAAHYPMVRQRKAADRTGTPDIPTGRLAVLKSAALSVLRQLRPVDASVRSNPQVLIPHVDQHWSRLAYFDSALVSSADGTKVSWYQRAPKRFASLMRRSTLAHTRLTREWSGLSRQYRAAAPDLTSSEMWRRTFGTAERSEAIGSEQK